MALTTDPVKSASHPMEYPFPMIREFEATRFSIGIADESDIEAVLRLRYDVFKREMGYNPSEDDDGLDQDQYDALFDHLIIKDLHANLIVATYRLLRLDIAKQHSGFYSENEFDLSCIYQHNFTFSEIGRACIKQNYRNQTVMSLLWTGVAKYCEYHQIQYLGGCTTVGRDAESAAMIYHYAKHINALADESLFPIIPNPQNQVKGYVAAVKATEQTFDVNTVKRELPPLLRAYFSIGGTLCPQPAYDPDFDVIDFFTVLHVDKNVRRIMRFFGS